MGNVSYVNLMQFQRETMAEDTLALCPRAGLDCKASGHNWALRPHYTLTVDRNRAGALQIGPKMSRRFVSNISCPAAIGMVCVKFSHVTRSSELAVARD